MCDRANSVARLLTTSSLVVHVERVLTRQMTSRCIIAGCNRAQPYSVGPLQRMIARLDEETVASIADAKRSIAAEHATLLRHALDAQAAAEVRRGTFHINSQTAMHCETHVCC